MDRGNYDAGEHGVILGGRPAGDPQRPGGGPGMLPMRPLGPSAPDPRSGSPDQGDHESERKRLTVGPGIGLSGRLTDCDRVVSEGEVRVVLQRVRAVPLTGTGRFTQGRAEVEE